MLGNVETKLNEHFNVSSSKTTSVLQLQIDNVSIARCLEVTVDRKSSALSYTSRIFFKKKIRQVHADSYKQG